ncbi:hypothetical protein D3C72_1759660 [compost metagenome]
MGASIKELIIDNRLDIDKLKIIAYPTKFIEHGTVEELEKIYGLDTKSIVDNYLQ